MADGAFLPGEGGMCGALISGRGADLRPKGLCVWGGSVLQRQRLFIGGNDGLHGRRAEAAPLQRPDPGDGGAAGRADGMLHGGGVLAGLESQLRRTWWYLIPSAVIAAMVATIYIMMSSHDLETFVRIVSYNEDFGSGTGLCQVMGYVRLAAKIIFTIEVVMVLVAGSHKISSYNKSIKAYYADTEGKRLVVYQWFMYVFTACAVASIIFNFLGRYRFGDSPWTIAIPSLTFSSLLYLLGFISLRQTFTIDNFVQQQAEDASILENLPDCESENSLARRIEEVVTQQQLFLRHNVKVSDIAAELFTNRLYVSTAINDEIGVSFSDYINKKRIDYAIQLMRTNPQMTMCEIADRSGFSSDKSFYRNFKHFTGKSPKKIDE